MEMYADVHHQLFEKLDLKDVMMVGYSTGGVEVARFLDKFWSSRFSQAVLVSVVTPLMLKTETNAHGIPLAVFDLFRAAIVKHRAQFFLDVPNGPCIGFNRERANASQGLIRSCGKLGCCAALMLLMIARRHSRKQIYGTTSKRSIFRS